MSRLNKINAAIALPLAFPGFQIRDERSVTDRLIDADNVDIKKASMRWKRSMGISRIDDSSVAPGRSSRNANRNYAIVIMR